MCRHYAFVMPIGQRTKALGEYEPDFAWFDFHNQYRQKTGHCAFLQLAFAFATRLARTGTNRHVTTQLLPTVSTLAGFVGICHYR